MSPIRKATKKDAKAILAIKNKARQDGYQKIVDQAYLDSLDISDERLHKFQQWIEKCDIFLVYEEKDNILGFICWGNTGMDDTPCPYVMSGFYVDPEYQRKGIGSKLFNAFKQQIKGNPFYLRTCSDSKGETFYKKQGWIPFWKKQAIIGKKTSIEIWFTFI